MAQVRLARQDTETITAVPSRILSRISFVICIKPMLSGNNNKGIRNCRDLLPSERLSDNRKLATNATANASINQTYFRSLNKRILCLKELSAKANNISRPITNTFKTTAKERKKEIMNSKNKPGRIISLLFIKESV